MRLSLSFIIRVSSYPLIFGLCSIALLLIAYGKLPYWPFAPVVAAIGIASIALLEHIQPYEKDWLADHDDTFIDVLHAVFSLSMIFVTVELVKYFRQVIHLPTLWPMHWPVWIQLLMAGAMIDFGLWFMHKQSHKRRFLWRLHAIHHNPERIYWLNGERRHPLSAILLAAPGIIIVVLLGVPATTIGCWMAITAVHLAFQHANLDYSVGPFRHLLGVAEVHRWHHKHGYAKANFGEFWMIWDHLFGTFHYHNDKVKANDVGIRTKIPNGYIKQLLWPFHKN